MPENNPLSVQQLPGGQEPPLDPQAARTTRGEPVRGEPARAAGGYVGFKPGVAAAPPRPGLAAAGARPVPALAPSRPAPVPRRPKGKLLVGGMLALVFLCGLYLLWDALFRYSAHGVVEGRVIRIAAPWSGTLHALHVREGDTVRQGQLLATLDNMELEQRLARLGDELRLAQASLEAESTQMRWQVQADGDRDQKALAEYYELWGRLLDEQARLAELELREQRSNRIRETSQVTAISDEQWEAVKYATSGQRSKVEKLVVAVEELKKRVELNAGGVDDPLARLRPQLVRIETLPMEIARLRELLKQGQIRSPVNGRVVKRHLFSGEHAASGQPIIEVLEDGSLEAVLYLPQGQADRFEVGESLRVRIEPYSGKLSCTVVRLGEQLRSPPSSIERHYHSGEKLVPLHLQPQAGLKHRITLRLDSVVKLPRSWLP